MLAVLEAHGLNADNTWVFVVGDHGEGLSMPAHHGRGHGRYLAPSVVGEAWLVRGPGVGPGARITGLASQVDIAPTRLGLAEVPGYDGPGHDLSPLLASGGKTERDRAWTSTWFHNANRAAVYTDHWMCQLDFGSEEGGRRFQPGCFDRGLDPDHGEVLENAALTDELRQWRADQDARVAGFDGENVIPSAEIREQLEALGYVD